MAMQEVRPGNVHKHDGLAFAKAPDAHDLARERPPSRARVSSRRDYLDHRVAVGIDSSSSIRGS
jgi:hypothetical protein